MAADYFVSDVRSLARFTPDQVTKADCFRSERLFAGINGLAKGQSQELHTHDRADKFYLVLSGRVRIVVGTEERELSAGAMAWAPAGIAHGIEEALEDSVVLVVMSPPPGGGKSAKGKE